MPYLEHHGIKGMHWGIRRTPEQLGRSPVFEGKKGGDSPSDAVKKPFDSASNTIRKTSELIKDRKTNEDLSVYSNKDLQDRITRMNLENTYRNLTAKPSKLKTGMKTAATVLEVVGGLTATAVAVTSLYDRFKNKG